MNRAFTAASKTANGARLSRARSIPPNTAPATGINQNPAGDAPASIERNGIREESEIRHSQGKSRAADAGADAQVGMAHLGEFALLRPKHRRFRPRVQDPAAAGDAAIHRRWLAGRWNNRQRLDSGKRRKASRGGKLHLLEGLAEALAMGVVRAGAIA